eukprot:UN05236
MNWRKKTYFRYKDFVTKACAAFVDPARDQKKLEAYENIENYFDKGEVKRKPETTEPETQPKRAPEGGGSQVDEVKRAPRYGKMSNATVEDIQKPVHSPDEYDETPKPPTKPVHSPDEYDETPKPPTGFVDDLFDEHEFDDR